MIYGSKFPVVLIALFWSVTAIAGKTDHSHDHDHAPRSANVNTNSPVLVGEYVENKGQWDQQVLYRADFGVTALFAEKSRLTFSKWEDGAADKIHESQHLQPGTATVLHGHAWYMNFSGAQENVVVERTGTSKDYFNYFLGNDPSKWASEVRHFEEVRYRELWPGVDLRLYDQEGGFKYDVELDRGDLVDQVRFTYEGLLRLGMDDQGRLQLTTSVGELYESVPVAWYADGGREAVDCSFVLEGNSVGFKLAEGTDLSRPVVIDPLLIASTLSGTGNIGTTQNYGHTATYDEDGNIYTGAICFGQGYPTTPGAFDATFGAGGGGGWGIDIAVSKLDPTGSNLLFATYLGGDGSDYPHSLVVTLNGHLTVYGSSDSDNYPTANAFDATFNGGWADIVVTKLNPTGTALIGSTYVGTAEQDGRNSLTSNYGDSYRGEILADASGRIYIASCTSGSGFPTSSGAYLTSHSGGQDGVAFCLSSGLNSMEWSTYVGTAGDDMCFGIKLSSSGEPYVCGGTSSNAFPTTPGVVQPASAGDQDAFVVHFNSDASALLGSTYFGTSGQDIAFFLQLDLDDDVYIYGQSPSGTVPIAPAGTYGNAGGGIFIAGFNADLTTQVFSTSIGPNAGGWSTGMVPVAFLVDVCDNIYISGYSVGSDWATTPGALYTAGGFYLAVYEENMAGITYGTYYEGAGHVDGGTSRFDANGIVYQAVCTSGPFPTTPTAFSNVQPSSWDVGVFKIDFQVAGVNAAGASTLNEGCAPIQIDFSNASTGDMWIWDFGDGSPTVEAFEPSHLYDTPGNYIVTLIAMDSLSCNLADTTFLPVTIGEPQVITADMVIQQMPDCDNIYMEGENLSTGQNIAFTWIFDDGTTSADTNVVHNYTTPGSYNVQLIAYDPTGCSPGDTVSQVIELQPSGDVTASFTVEEVPGCDELTVNCQNTSLAIAPMLTWDMGDGTELTGDQISHVYQGVGTYTITLMVSDTSICGQSDQTTMDVTVLPSEPISADFTADQVFDCDNLLLTTQNNSTGTNAVYDWQLSDGAQYTSENVEHTFSGAGTYTITLTVTDSLGCYPTETATMDVVIDPIVPVVADFDLAQVGNCVLLTVETINQSTGDSISISWDMGDGTIYTDEAPTHSYTDPGTYNVTLTITDLGCGNDDEMTIPVEMINELPIVTLGDTVVCPDATAELVAGGTPGNYIWSTGATTQSIVVEFGGSYTVTVTNDVCQGTATVEVIQGVEMELAYEVDACPNEAVDITVPIEGLAYEWSTGGNARTEQVVGAGDYIFHVIDPLGCPHTDTVTVIALDEEPQLFAPNAFSPDGDGVNEIFKVVGYGEEDVDFTIYNRWGELLWTSKSAADGWDGMYKGVPVKNDVYVYQLKYTGKCNAEEREVIGHVTVLR